MKIGFTGTRNGMTDAQKKCVARIFLDNCGIELHHGACLGADEDAVALLMDPGFHCDYAVAHPGMSAKGGDNQFLSKQAINLSKRVEPAKTHFARNRDIVNETGFLIACPPSEPMPTSGGTAYTVEYAKKIGRRVLIVWPKGTMDTIEAR